MITRIGLPAIPRCQETTAVYDGPCPPWNNAIVHHYHFSVYALNAQHLKLPAKFSGAGALKAMPGHVVAKGEVIGVYALNPAVMKKIGVK